MKYNFQFLILLSAIVLATACGSSTTAAEAAATEGSSSVAFGEEFTPEDVTPYEDLAMKMTNDGEIAATVRGEVSGVCQAKGCWMTITQANGEEMMVKFKDYGFFMPKDIAGREVIMHGKASYQTTPVDELRHYAEDAGKTQEEIEAITEPKRELSFLADGVILIEK
jgi:hypothetical protein